ncbi:cyclin-like protein, partial [Fistulina hepatica ATCC 64428]
MHNPQLVQLLAKRVSLDMVEHITRQTEGVIRVEGDVQPSQLLPLKDFMINLIKRSNVHTPTLLMTLIYLERLKNKFPSFSRSMSCTRHRVFLATLIVAAKYLNDSSPKNEHWAKYSLMFDVTEVNLMEMQLLHLLDFDLRFSEEQIVDGFAPFM